MDDGPRLRHGWPAQTPAPAVWGGGWVWSCSWLVGFPWFCAPSSWFQWVLTDHPPPCATLLPGRWERRDGLKELASQTGDLVLPCGTHHDRLSAQKARQFHVAVWLGECLDTRVLMSRFDMSWVTMPLSTCKNYLQQVFLDLTISLTPALAKRFFHFLWQNFYSLPFFFPWKVLLLWSEE